PLSPVGETNAQREADEGAHARKEHHAEKRDGGAAPIGVVPGTGRGIIMPYIKPTDPECKAAGENRSEQGEGTPHVLIPQPRDGDAEADNENQRPETEEPGVHGRPRGSAWESPHAGQALGETIPESRAPDPDLMISRADPSCDRRQTVTAQPHPLESPVATG